MLDADDHRADYGGERGRISTSSAGPPSRDTDEAASSPMATVRR